MPPRFFSSVECRAPPAAACRPLSAAAFLAAGPRLRQAGFIVAAPGSKAQPPQLWRPQHIGSSQTRDQTRVSCIGRRILHRRAAREAPPNFYFTGKFHQIQGSLPQTPRPAKLRRLLSGARGHLGSFPRHSPGVCGHCCRPFPWSPQPGQAPGHSNRGARSLFQQEASPGQDCSGPGGQPSEGRKAYRAPFPTDRPADGLPGPTRKGFGRAPSQPVCGGGVGPGCGLTPAALPWALWPRPPRSPGRWAPSPPHWPGRALHLRCSRTNSCPRPRIRAASSREEQHTHRPSSEAVSVQRARFLKRRRPSPSKRRRFWFVLKHRMK